MKILLALLLSILTLSTFAELDTQDENELQIIKDIIAKDEKDDLTEPSEKENEEDQVAEYENDSEDTEDHKNAIKADPQELARRRVRDPWRRRVPNQRRRRRRRLWEARRRSL